MQELRLVAVSEDGSYAILAVPGRGGRFSLPIDDRLRAVARGQLSRLAQYEIEVENPLRPKEIQDRIRAGQTADEIADLAGIPIERIRRFEGPVLAEREYRAQEAQRATVRSPGDSGPGPRLGEAVAERLSQAGVAEEDTRWDSRKRSDGNWQVHLTFSVGGRSQAAEWIFDPQRRHVVPDDEQAARLCLTDADLAAIDLDPDSPATATVTPIARRHAGAGPHYQPRDPRGQDGASDFPGPRDYQAQREQAQREHTQRELAQREQAQHEAQQDAAQRSRREQPAWEPGRREAPHRDQAQREAAHREQTHRDQAERERQVLRARALEQARRDHPSREQARDAGPREPAQRETAQGETAQRESAQREPVRGSRERRAAAGTTGERPASRAQPQPTAPRPDPVAESETSQAAPRPVPERPARKAAGGRSRRASVPSWDEIMFGNSRNSD